MKFLLFLLFTMAWFPSYAEEVIPSGISKELITEDIVKSVRSKLEQDIVIMSIQSQNNKFIALSSKEIDDMDKQWRKERESDDQPLIAETLASPVSSYLKQVQIRSRGLYDAIFIMDKNGLNVGQSAITSDFWQGDEAKFEKTFGTGENTVFIDDPEYDKDIGIWISQLSFTIFHNSKLIGTATVDINLTELHRRSLLKTEM